MTSSDPTHLPGYAEQGTGASPLATGLSQAEPEVSALRASIPCARVSHDFSDFMQRLQAFADEWCRKQPSLGMIGEMAWVFGVEIDFRLIPREDASGTEARSGETACGLDPKDDGPVRDSADAHPTSASDGVMPGDLNP
jgi:hypothetical protein